MSTLQYAYGGNDMFAHSLMEQSRGASEDSQKITRYGLDWKKHYSIPSSICSREKDVAELFNEIYANEYRSDNWDGENAKAIQLATIHFARYVVALFDKKIPLPEVVPEPNGDVGMEWVFNNEHIVISISKDAGYTYAYISDEGGRQYGSGKLRGNGIPDNIIRLLQE